MAPKVNQHLQKEFFILVGLLLLPEAHQCFNFYIICWL